MTIKGIDIFSGAGGMSLGASWAGVETVLAVDADPHASETYKKNHPDTTFIADDIRNIEDFAQFRPDSECVVYGGPPCQGFSTSNQRTRGLGNGENWLFLEFLRAVQQIDPEWVVFENVRGILETESAFFLKRVMSELAALGYHCRQFLLNAAKFGVPQTRSRLFIVASKSTHTFDIPICEDQPQVSVDDAIADLPMLDNGSSESVLAYGGPVKSEFARSMRGESQFALNNFVTRNSDSIVERYRHVPQGGNWEQIPLSLMSNYQDRTRCHTGIYRRLRPDKPSITIGNYRKNMLIHPHFDRGLSVREAARLQSFPDWYEFTGSIGFQQQQVGNAVPPLLAKAVFDHTVCNKHTVFDTDEQIVLAN